MISLFLKFAALIGSLSLALIGAVLVVLPEQPSRVMTFHASNNTGDIIMLDLQTRFFLNLINNPAAELEYEWSPDGERIAFVSNRDLNREVFVMDFNGRNVRQLTFGSTDSLHPVWSPDGTQIAYVFDVTTADANQDIYVVDVESGISRQITSNISDDDYPVWSPDGKYIAYLSNRIPTGDHFTVQEAENEVYLLNLETGEDEFLAEIRPSIETVIWSPDSKTLALGRNTGGIYLFSLETREVKPFTDFGRFPNWSPDGEEIVYVQNPDGYCTVRMDDGIPNCHPLLNTSIPRWSPDGRLIAFTGIVFLSRPVLPTPVPSTSGRPQLQLGGGLGPYEIHLYVVNPDGSTQYEIRIDGEYNLRWRP